LSPGPLRGARVAAALLFALLLVSGCASGRHVRVRLTPGTTLPDQPLHIRVSGLHGGEVATVRLRARDTRGRLWRSAARFRADGSGTVDLDRQAPLSGSYRRVWGDGLLASLSRASIGAFFVWSGSRQPSLRVEVLANGGLLASRAIRRRLPNVEQRTLVVARAGFYGRYYAPPARHARGVPVLVFGGSEGGLSFPLLASVLALHGHPTLALAYFNAPGLPQTLSRIPLEYFARAIRWLRDRPKVGGRRIAVIGVSRGSEAAQLLGVHYPSLVGAVVATVPSKLGDLRSPVLQRSRVDLSRPGGPVHDPVQLHAARRQPGRRDPGRADPRAPASRLRRPRHGLALLPLHARDRCAAEALRPLVA
jgi:hypothetical protein